MLEKIIRDFVMIWTTVDPISTLALFAGLTASLSTAERRGVARRGIFYAAIILVVAVVLGQIILDAMGIRLLSLKVAGGIILFLFGLQMLFGSVSLRTRFARERSRSRCFSSGCSHDCWSRGDHGGNFAHR